MSPEQFTKAVAIPQGQFAELLTAPEGQRTAILKGIFRLDHLGAAKDHADGLLRRWRDPTARRRGQRQMLPADPDAALAEAEDALGAADADVNRLVEAVDTACKHVDAAEDAEREAAAVRGAAQAVAQRREPGRARSLTALAELEALPCI